MTAQFIATLGVATLCGLVWGFEEARSAVFGGGCVLVPAMYFAWRLSQQRSPSKLLAMGVGKFVSTCALLALAMVVARPSPLGFFAALIVAQGMYVLVPATWSGLPRR